MPAEVDKPLGRGGPNAPLLRILEVHSLSSPNQGFPNESNESSFTVTKCLKKARRSLSDQEYDKIFEKVITPLSSVLKSTPAVQNTPPYVKSVQSDFLAMWKFMNSISERDLTHLDAVYGATLKKNEAAVVPEAEMVLRDKGEPEKTLSSPVKLADGSSNAEIRVQSEPPSSARVTSSQEVTQPESRKREPRKPDRRKPESRELKPKKPFRILQNETAPPEAPGSSNEKQNPGSLPPSRDDSILRNDDPAEEYSPLKNEYSLGSVVLAHLDGFPWWPAIVDDDPDNNYYYWLGNGSTDKPTHYHVVFFSKPVSRAWRARSRLQPYNEKTMGTLKVKEAALYDRRLRYAIRRAEIAVCIEQEKRLHFYGFLAKYKGKVGDLRSKGALKRYTKNGHKRSSTRKKL